MFIILTIISAIMMAVNFSLVFTYDTIQLMSSRKWTYLKWAVVLYVITLAISLTSIGGIQTAGVVSIWSSPLAVWISTILLFNNRSWQYVVANAISLISASLLTYMVIFAPKQFMTEMVKGAPTSISMIAVSFSVVMPIFMIVVGGVTSLVRSFAPIEQVDFVDIQKAIKSTHDKQMEEIRQSKKTAKNSSNAKTKKVGK